MDRERLVCRCYQISEGEIVDAIQEANLRTVEEVTARTNAAGGCSSCYDDVQAILNRIHGGRPTASRTPGRPDAEKREILAKLLRELIEPLYAVNGVRIHVQDVKGPRVFARYEGPTVGTTLPSILTLKWLLVKSMSDLCGERMQLIELNMIDRGIAEDPA